MIVYFSGTGNSKYVASRLNEFLKDEIISLNDYIKSNKKIYVAGQDRLIIVSPTYSWRLPNLLRDYFLSLDIEKFKNLDTYFVLTCGDEIGNAKKYNKLLAEKLNLNYKGTAGIIMPENYIAMFSVPNKEESLKIINSSEKNIDDLIEVIRNNQAIKEAEVGFLDKFKSSFVHNVFYKFFVSDKKFLANDKCILCGKCEKVCPLNNIKIQDKKVKWMGTCTHCMACICSCPTQAIEYGSKSKGKNRYLCPKG